MKPKVYVVEKDDVGFVFRWKDEAGRWRQRKCDSRTRRSAERAARDLEDELIKASPEPSPIKVWGSFCDRYQIDHLEFTSSGNQVKWDGVCKHFRNFMSSRGCKDVTDLQMTAFDLDLLISFESWLTRRVGSAATVDSYIKTLRAGLSFAAEIGWATPIPKRRQRGRSPSQKPKMKGRPVVGEEVDRLLWAADKILEKKRRQGFKELIKAYWLGGLRRGEPLDFHWKLEDYHLPLLDGDIPRVAFSELQKSRKSEIVAITGGFANFLKSIRKDDGWVFNPLGVTGERLRTGQSLGRVIKAISVKANVVIKPATKGKPAVYATAQNLRQGLAYWLHGKGVSPATMKHIMRHADWKTTMEFYAGQGANEAYLDVRKAESTPEQAAREIGESL